VRLSTAHEDDARRAVHTGLGIVEAIATLNTRLMGQYDRHEPLQRRLSLAPIDVEHRVSEQSIFEANSPW
jgi:hypothetical protein